MAFDPRSRVGVTIDGRKYTRKPSYYIDVSHIPSITAAVDEASRQLRRGIMFAMSSCPEDEAVAAAAPLKPSQPEKRPRPTAPPPIRDPGAVYAAVTRFTKGGSATASQAAKKEKGKKEKEQLDQDEEEKDEEKKDDTDNEVECTDVEESGNEGIEKVSIPDAATKVEEMEKSDLGKVSPSTDPAQWSSVRKAGPSILSKRPRSIDDPRASVFQPPPKRQDRTTTTTKTSSGSNSPTDTTAKNEKSADAVAAAVSKSATKKAQASASIATTSPSKKVADDVKAKPSSKVTATKAVANAKPSSKVTATKASSAASSASSNKPNSLPVRSTISRRENAKAAKTPTSRANVTTATASTSAAATAAATTAAASAAVSGASKQGTNASNSGAVKRSSLPASWSQVGNSNGARRVASPSNVLAMLRRGRGGSSNSGPLTGIAAVRAAASAARAGSSTSRSRGNANIGHGYVGPLPALGPLSGAQASATARDGASGSSYRAGSGVSMAPSGRPAATVGESEIPLPTAMGLNVQYVPGAKTIDGVRPNGYTVGREGTVRPVVTFNPKAKLPHKLRQTSVEKLFEGWRDFRKEPEAEALAAALRTEQEIYVNSSSRVDYRAAITVKLKELRNK